VVEREQRGPEVKTPPAVSDPDEVEREEQQRILAPREVGNAREREQRPDNEPGQPEAQAGNDERGPENRRERAREPRVSAARRDRARRRERGESDPERDREVPTGVGTTVLWGRSEPAACGPGPGDQRSLGAGVCDASLRERACELARQIEGVPSGSSAIVGRTHDQVEEEQRVDPARFAGERILAVRACARQPFGRATDCAVGHAVEKVSKPGRAIVAHVVVQVAALRRRRSHRRELDAKSRQLSVRECEAQHDDVTIAGAKSRQARGPCGDLLEEQLTPAEEIPDEARTAELRRAEVIRQVALRFGVGDAENEVPETLPDFVPGADLRDLDDRLRARGRRERKQQRTRDRARAQR